MSHKLDHVVFAVKDLAASVKAFSDLGFTVYPGGEHQGRSSHNALIMLADSSYLELKAWRAPAPQELWWRILEESGEGLVDFALQTQTPEEDLAAARARGLLTLRGPVPGERVRPDGQYLKWTTARHDTPDVPFLCGDITPRNLRVPDAPELLAHANGATGVAHIAVAVSNIETTFARWQALLGPNVAPKDIEEDASRGLRLVHIPLDGFDVTLASPTTVAGDPAMTQRLATRGEGPYSLALRGVSADWREHAASFGFV